MSGDTKRRPFVVIYDLIASSWLNGAPPLCCLQVHLHQHHITMVVVHTSMGIRVPTVDVSVMVHWIMTSQHVPSM
jgi:predicted naringenin-chalcone synthase